MSAACLSEIQKCLKLSDKQHMGSFYASTWKTDCLQILCKFCKNWISVPNIVHQLTLSLRCKYSCSNFPDAINSIRRFAASSGQANDVSILWRHSSWVRGRSYVLIEGHFWRFWDNLNPKMLSAIVWKPKMHFFTSQHVFWAISREIPCTGCSSRRVRGKNKNNKKTEALYFTYLVRRSPAADWHKFWVKCSSRGRNQLCKVLS